MAALKDQAPKLNARHQRFVAEYLIDLNGTQAAIRAGYSPKSARHTAVELLARADVQEHVTAGRNKAAEVAGVTRERVLQELAAIAFADIRDVVTWKRDVRKDCGHAISNCPGLPDCAGALRQVWEISPRDSDTLSPAAAAAILEVSEKDGRLRFKMHAKVRALEHLAEHLRLFDPEVETKKPTQLTPDNVVDIWERARARARAKASA